MTPGFYKALVAGWKPAPPSSDTNPTKPTRLTREQKREIERQNWVAEIDAYNAAKAAAPMPQITDDIADIIHQLSN